MKWYVCAVLLLLMACKTPKQYYYSKKILNYWEGEYNGAKIWFKVLYGTERNPYREFYAAFAVEKGEHFDVLKLRFRANGFSKSLLEERGFSGQSVPNLRFDSIEPTDSVIGASFDFDFDLKQFSPFELVISNSFWADDLAPLHPNAAHFIDVFPIRDGQGHCLTLTEKTISMKRIREIYYKMLKF